MSATVLNSRSSSHDFIVTQERIAHLEARPTAAQIDELMTGLHDLAGAAHEDPSSKLEFQRTLHWLHYGDHESSYPIRRWLASTVYDYFADTAEPVALAEPLSPDQLSAELATTQKELSPLGHPLFKRVYGEHSTRAEFNIYLKQKWIIMLTFWRSLAEFGDRLQRIDLHNTALAYKNVHEELGEGDAAKAHLMAHYRLMQHLGIEATWDDQPEYAETYEYINFRLFCMRHANPAWGCGSFYSQEATSLEYTLGHYHKLRSLGIEHEHCAIYHEHDEIDAEHTDEIESVIVDLARSAEDQATVLRAQRHQMRLWHAHFDRVLDEIQRCGSPS